MINIKIDDIQVTVKQGSRIIEVADYLKIPIPRFCYHEKLSIAANCRMCLVEIANVPKLLPACSTHVTEGMQIFTKSSKTIAGQKSVMELLLLNHPLDCPICEQAGECELQDLSLQFGKDTSRYKESKRTVVDQNLGPLIATNMTRCIHCTRCIRFGEEIAGTKELGAIHRGECMKITIPPDTTITSDVSGNIIDLCPVGALTSKPFMYNSSRSWELKQVASISCHDCLGSNIYYHVNNSQVKRAVPANNPKINSIWLSDRDRFGFIGINAQDRLKHPLLKKDDKWRIATWQEALSFIHQKLSNIIEKDGAHNLGGLIWPNATLEEFFLYQKLFKNLGSGNIDHRLRQLDFRAPHMAPSYPSLGLTTVAELASRKFILLIGCHVNKEQPIAGIHIRAATLAGCDVVVVNPIDFSFNFNIYTKYIGQHGNILTPLLQIAKAITTATVNPLPHDAAVLLKNIEYDNSHLEIAKKILSTENGKASIILGSLAVNHPEYSNIVAISNLICLLTNAKFGSFSDGANSAGAWLAGCVADHNTKSLNARQMLQSALKGYILLGIEPELDCAEGASVTNTLLQSEFVVAITSFESELLLQYSDVLLPMAAPQESYGTYINVTGMWQEFSSAVPPIGESKTAAQILTMIAQTFGWDFADLNITDIVKQSMNSSINNTTWQYHNLAIEQYCNHSINTLVKIAPISLYATDPIIRRSKSLQETNDATIKALINPQSAKYLDIQTGDVVKIISYNNIDNIIQLPIIISSTVPEGCILINQINTKTLVGLPYSMLTLEKLILEKMHV